MKFKWIFLVTFFGFFSSYFINQAVLAQTFPWSEVNHGYSTFWVASQNQNAVNNAIEKINAQYNSANGSFNITKAFEDANNELYKGNGGGYINFCYQFPSGSNKCLVDFTSSSNCGDILNSDRPDKMNLYQQCLQLVVSNNSISIDLVKHKISDETGGASFKHAPVTGNSAVPLFQKVAIPPTINLQDADIQYSLPSASPPAPATYDISFDVRNASYCTLTGENLDMTDNDEDGSVRGSRTISSLKGVYPYTLTCKGYSGKTDSITKIINVGDNKPLRITSFTASPKEIISGEGTPVTLSVKFGNPSSEIDLGSVSINNTPVHLDNNEFGSITVSPNETTKYVVSAKSSWEALGGTSAEEIVTVVTPPRPEVSCKIDPASIQAGKGNEVTLSWAGNQLEVNSLESLNFSSSPPVTQRLPVGHIKELTGFSKLFIPGSVRDDIALSITPISKWTYWKTRKDSLSVSCGIHVAYPDKPKVVSFKSVPERVKSGESATLEWEVANAKQVVIDGGVGTKPTKGTFSVSPKYTTTYTLTAYGEISEVGSSKSKVTVRVDAPTIGKIPQEVIVPDAVKEKTQPVAKDAVDLKVNGQDGPLTMAAPANIALSWNLNRYCLGTGSWLTIKRAAGEEQRVLEKSGVYTYRLYCPGIGSDSVVVNVSGGGAAGEEEIAVPLPIAEATISTDGKNFSKSIRVTRGEPVNIWIGASYDADGDRKVSRDDAGGWGSTMIFGGRCEFNADLNQSPPTFDGAVFDPGSPEDCTTSIGELIFADSPGVRRYGVLRLVQSNGKVSNISYVNVAVQAPPEPTGPPVIDLRVNGVEDSLTIGAPADYTVSWLANNATSCEATDAWDGEKLISGTQRFIASSKRELTYTLTCQGKLGWATKSVTVKVAELPVCDFSALPTVLDKRSVFDRQSVLSWKCRFANSCSITPDTGAKIDTFGSVRVSPSVSTTYVLSCGNLDGSSDFPASVEVR